jgi:hypothetical protein
LFIAQKARVAPGRVILLRERGLTWMQVALRLGLSPEVFYVRINNASRSPYAKPYGYYQRYQRIQWRDIRLSDADIVNFVNLRFISDKYRCTPDEVVLMRSQGRSFVKIHEDWRVRTAPRVAAQPSHHSPAPYYAKENSKRMDKNPGRPLNGNR